MSYILDALKKSEQQKRERDGDSGVDMTPLMMTATPAAETPRLPWFVWVMAAALIGLMASVAVLLWLPADNAGVSAPVVAEADAVKASAVVEQPAVAEASAPVAPKAPAPVLHKPPVVQPAAPVVIKPGVPEHTVNPVVVKPASVNPPVAKAPEPAPRLITPSTPKKTAPEPAVASANTPEVEKISEFEQRDDVERASDVSRPGVERRLLPPLTSLRKIPDLIITSHIYSDDASTRSVSMNGRNWHEGSWIAPGVTLDKITETGILLDVEGFPFPVHRQNGWQSIAE